MAIHSKGYLQTKVKGHHRADSRGYVFDHILIVERAMGCKLPKNACVHHVNGDVKDNINTNLIVCENNAYHKLLHKRATALQMCGNANYIKCAICKKWDDKDNLYVNRHNARHRECWSKYYNDNKDLFNLWQRIRRRRAKCSGSALESA